MPTLAFVISAVTTLLLLLGAAVGRLGSPTAGSSVTVLLAGSVLFAAAVARGGEHRLVRGIFVGQRWLLSITAIAALRAAASVAFGAAPGVRDTIWYAAGGASALGLSRPRGSIHASRAAEAQAGRARHRRQDVTMTFSKLTAFVARDRRLPPERLAARLAVRPVGRTSQPRRRARTEADHARAGQVAAPGATRRLTCPSAVEEEIDLQVGAVGVGVLAEVRRRPRRRAPRRR